MLSIVAIMAVHNGDKTLRAVLSHLADNNIDAYVIDHGSTDQTAEILVSESKRAVKEILHIPFDGVFRLRDQLRIKEDLARKLRVDWIIHLDADEIMDSPREGESLRGMIERLSSLNFDVIDCDEFVFVPTQEDDSEPLDFIDAMQDYYHFARVGRSLHRVQRMSGAEFDWSATGGHRLPLLERRLASEKIRLRHYIGVSYPHLQAQYLSRVFAGEELRSGWHINRVATSVEFVQRPDKKALFNLKRDGWRTDSAQSDHLVFQRKTRYVLPKPVVVCNDMPPMPFIVGVGRSGTTLLRLLIDAHPDMAIPPETHWLLPVLNQMLTNPQDKDAIKKSFLDEASWADMCFATEDLDALLAQHDVEKPVDTVRAVYRQYAARNGASRCGDKTPLHGLQMTRIATCMPEARFIHVIRDGRDVALSFKDLWFGPGRDPRKAAVFWMWRIREIRQQAQFIPNYLEVRYENLVKNPENTLREIAEFIKLPFSSEQLQAHTRSSERLSELGSIIRKKRVITAQQRQSIHSLTAQPPDSSRIGRWKKEMDLNDRRAFEAIAGSMLNDLGYE